MDVDHDGIGRNVLRHVLGGVPVGRERPVMEHGSPAGSILEPSDTAEEERPALRYSSPRPWILAGCISLLRCGGLLCLAFRLIR